MAKLVADKLRGCMGAGAFSTADIALLEQRAAELRKSHEFEDENHVYAEAAARIAQNTGLLKQRILDALAHDERKGAGFKPTADEAARQTPPHERFAAALEELTPRNRKIVLDALGLDADLSHSVDEAKSLSEVAQSVVGEGNRNSGKPMSKEGVRKVVRAFLERVRGDSTREDLTPDAADEAGTGEHSVTEDATFAQLEASEPHEGGIDQAAEGPTSGVISSVGGSQGRIESAGRGLITNQPWYAKAREVGLLAMEPHDLGELAAHATAYVENARPENRAALDAIFHAVHELSKDLQSKEEISRAYDKVRDLTPVDRESPEGSADGAAHAGGSGVREGESARSGADVAGDAGPGKGSEGAVRRRGGAAGADRVQVQPREAAEARAVETSQEHWERLHKDTPGMPAWGDLSGRQQSQWADLHEREQANLAAAQQVAGDRVLKSADSAEERDGVIVGHDELRPTSQREFLRQPGQREALSRLQRLGLGHVVNWVNAFAFAPERSAEGKPVADGWLVGSSGESRKAETVLVVNEGLDAQTQMWVTTHELAHVADMAPFGGVFSSDPHLHPGGEVYDELRALHDKGGFWGAVFDYPMGEKYADLDDITHRGEVFAQAFATFASPGGRAKMLAEAPKTAAFMKEVASALHESTTPSRAHPEEVAARRAAFSGGGVGGGAGQDHAAVQGDAGPRTVAQGREAVSEAQARSAHRAAQAVAALEREQTVAGRIVKAMPEPARNAFTDVRNFFKRVGPWMLTNLQLVKEYGSKIDALKQYVGVADMLRQERTRMQMEFNGVATDWDKLPSAAKERLSPLMQRATLQEMHPDLPFEHEGNAHLKRADAAEEAALRDKHAKLQREYSALKAAFPKAIEVYQRAKAVLEKSWRERAQAYERLIDETYSDSLADAMAAGDTERAERLRKQGEEAQAEYRKTLSSIKGPYFPLMRFGEYLAIGKSDEYKAAEDALTVASDSGRKQAQERLDALKRDSAHYIVSAHELRSQSEAAQREYGARGLDTSTSGMGALKLGSVRPMTKDTVSHLTDAVASKIGGETSGALRDALLDVFLKGLPELHALRREAERKGVAGAAPDMLRAFSAAGQSNAFYASRLMYAKQLADTMFQMGKEVKGHVDLQHVHREMQQRAALDMRFTRTPLQDVAASASWIYHLGLSPSFVLMNASQPWMISVPVLAGKFGVASATRAMAQASRDALAVLRDARVKDGKWDWWSGISEDSIPGASRNEDRAAIRKLIQRGIVDEGAQHELGMYAADSSRWMSKTQRVMGWTTQQVEVVNRLATGLAAFRLARRSGMTEEKATDYAYDTTHMTQFDYTPEASARFMREGGGIPAAKLIFQFRRYQQSMLYLIGANARKAFADGEEGKQARATLAYLSLATGMGAGVLGLPFMGAALALANALLPSDDEQGDAETQLRNALVHMTGDKKTAEVLAKGLPAMWGWDLSKRIGLQDIGSALPMARYDQAKTGRDAMAETLLNVVGPAAGMGAQMLDGLRLFGQGDFAKGTEKIAPKALADLVRAGRYSTQGMTDSKGELILGPDELSAWDKISRAAGVASTTESNYYEGTKAIKNVEAALADRKTRIANHFRAAVEAGSDLSSVREQIIEFNSDHPTRRITPRDEADWRKAAVLARRQRDETGIRYNPKKDRSFAGVLDFAR